MSKDYDEIREAVHKELVDRDNYRIAQKNREAWLQLGFIGAVCAGIFAGALGVTAYRSSQITQPAPPIFQQSMFLPQVVEYCDKHHGGFNGTGPDLQAVVSCKDGTSFRFNHMGGRADGTRAPIYTLKRVRVTKEERKTIPP